MVSFRFGGKGGRSYSLEVSDNLVAVRTWNKAPVAEVMPYEIAPISDKARNVLGEFDLITRFRDAGVDVLHTGVARGARALRDKARTVLKREPSIRFAGRVLVDPKSCQPVLYSENLFVKFDDDTRASTCRTLLKRKGLTIKRQLSYVRNAYFVEAKEGTGLEVFNIAEQLLNESAVEFCHPELLRRVRRRAAFPEQWHLKRTTVNGQLINEHANVEAAWPLSTGEGIIIAIIDDGVDLDHEELRPSSKVVAPRDVTRGTDNPRPGSGNHHGTACAGVACANGQFGASGVAPKARLMPIRLVSGLGSQAEADAFIWAAQHGADVISCSWGPADGDWWDDTDPVHNEVVPLPDNTRLAIDWAIANGRGGKGCVITWAAGNGNESVDNDGYASYAKVIAVAACNDRGQKSTYSDFGEAVWCAFPSNHGNPSRTPGIWTTDRSGLSGYNDGDTQKGDAEGDYTNDFGGTSSACPGVAGVAGLVLARNPELRWDEVKSLLKQSADRIDTGSGNYNANGHSALYGYGRVNARKAVEIASPAQPLRVVRFTATQDVPINDFKTSRLDVPVAESAPLKAIRITVDIEHTYIGDLIVSIKPPTSTGVRAIVLHQREGRGTDNIKKTYDIANTPALLNLNGKNVTGTWTLVVEDKERIDIGKIRSGMLEISV